MTFRVITAKTEGNCHHNFRLGDVVVPVPTPEAFLAQGGLLYVREDGILQLLKPEDLEETNE